MAISQRVRKVLWARSGNRCALCRRSLTLTVDSTDLPSVIGDECHIRSRTTRGPRAAESPEDVDSLDNLILLCKNDHKLVDDHPELFTEDILLATKLLHEIWVQASLESSRSNDDPMSPARAKSDELKPLERVISGNQLVSLIREGHMYSFGNCDLKDKSAVELVASFLQLLQDYGDILGGLDVGKVVRIEAQLGEEIKQLESQGLHLYGRRGVRLMKLGDQRAQLNVASIFVLPQDTAAAFDRGDGSVLVLPRIGSRQVTEPSA